MIEITNVRSLTDAEKDSLCEYHNKCNGCPLVGTGECEWDNRKQTLKKGGEE